MGECCTACGSGIAKIILFVLNLIVWIAGCTLLGLGAYMYIKSDDFSYILDSDTIYNVAILLMATGGFLFLVGLSGCYGACAENVCCLMLYFGLMFIVLIMQLVGAVLAFIYQDDLKAELQDTMSTTIKEKYGNTKEATDAIDYVQENFKCCGAESFTEWLLDFESIPTSCCKVENCLPIPGTVYEKGCVEAVDDWGKKNLLILGGLSLGLLVFELIPMCLACCLRKMIKDE
ncbi:CD151 antigen-like [Anneissia japonica]|uniref:CD151 antigen-like n=1 Tax=Anneissia japonica TaxID=1529436 RepID=UPI001425AA45|nr:CD151 antigen-like [Anneissia japonica]